MTDTDAKIRPSAPSTSKRILIWALIIFCFWSYRELYPRMEKQLDQRPTESRVYDQANLFSEGQFRNLDLIHLELLLNHGIDYAVLTHTGTGDIERFALDRFAELEVGEKSQAGHGLLLVIDPEQDEVRLEVSQSLEGVYVDAFIAYVEQRQMVPFFQENRIADGVQATTELIVQRAIRARQNLGFEGEAWAPAAMGAGATTQASIGSGYDAPSAPEMDSVNGKTPLQVVHTYIEAMQNRNANPDLSIYSAETRQMLSKWVVTPAQMDNVASSYRKCPVAQLRLQDQYAVFRYPVKQRRCAPWFLVREDGEWRLDLTMMQKAIRFNTENEWRFVQPETHQYQFAFDDWERDRNGFPHLAN